MNNFVRLAGRMLRRRIPKNRAGDYAVSLFSFCRRHRRLPLDRSLINSYLFNLKTSDEALNPLRHYVADKEHVKSYVQSKVGDSYNVPTLAVLHSKADVDHFDFPNRCCIKPTHASAKVIIRKDGEVLDKEELKSWFDIDYYLSARELFYRYLQPKLIIEPLIFDSEIIEDYKFYCYKGKPRLCQVDMDRHFNHTRLYFDEKWEKLNFSMNYPKSEKNIEKPASFELMLQIAAKLSEEFEFMRVDLYTDGRHVLVGELTNCPTGANGIFFPREAERDASRVLFQE